MKKKGIGLLLLLLCSIGLQAQIYNVSQYSLEEGLVQSQVRAICQDNDGFIWMGTHRGICRFDGKHFKDFQPEDGLAGRFVSTIIKDEKGKLWIGTENGVSYFDGKKFRNYTEKEGLTSNAVSCLMIDKEERLWVGTENGIAIIDKNTVSRLELPGQAQIYAMVQDNLGKVWIGTNQSLIVYHKGKIETLSEFRETSIRAILLDENQRVWLGTDKGIMRYEPNRGKVVFSQNVTSEGIFCLVKDKENVMWAGTQSGIIRLAYQYVKEGENIQLRVNSTPFTAKNWSNTNTVHAAQIDTEGNLWFGTEGEGVYKIRKGSFVTFDEKDNKIAKSFLEDAQKNIWISTTNNGISILNNIDFLNSRNTQISRITEENGLVSNDICASFEDKEGDFWFATYNGGVSRIKGNEYQNFTIKNGLSSNKTFCIAEDANRHIWIGTDVGISIWQRTHFSYLTKEKGLISNSVYAIFPDSKGQIWIGTPAGISLWGENGKIRDFTTKDSLADNLVLSFKEDKKGNIWAATSKGLGLWDGKKWSKMLLPGNAAANDIVAIVFEKGDDKLWVGTNSGVFRVDVNRYYKDKTLVFEHFTTADGLPSLECNGNAAFCDSNGNIWMGTIEGAVCYPANNINNKVDAPPIVMITDIELFFKPLQKWLPNNYAFDEKSGLPLSLSLPHNENHLTFDFIGICHSKPSSVRYQFTLEGFDTDWQPITEETHVTYSNLPPGTYTFKVKATNNMGTWADATPFTFVILKPFWLRWWFILFMLALLSAVGYTIYRFWQIRADEKRQQAQMQTKSELLQLEQQALYAMMNPHFTFNALQSIQYFIHIQDKVAANKFLSQFAKLIRMNLDSTQSDFISLHDEVERLKLYLSLEKMRFQEKFDYEIIVAGDIDKSATFIPPMILQPFVENSIKHGIMPLEQKGEKGEIYVKISELDEKTLEVLVQDNGIGIEASRKMKADRPSDHVSKGMQITRDRLNLFSKTNGKNYEILIAERHHPDGSIAGTEVRILLPVKG